LLISPFSLKVLKKRNSKEIFYCMEEISDNGSLPLGSLKLLKKDMEEKEWVITCFPFIFKKYRYIIMAKRYIGKKPSEYALLDLDFIRAENSSEHLEIPANSRGLIFETKNEIVEMRKFFKIEWSNKLGDVFKIFHACLGKCIPKSVQDSDFDSNKQLMVKKLSGLDSEDSSKIYCFAVKRNPVSQHKIQKKRSIFNGQKTMLLRPKLYEYFSSDKTISFCYSANRNDEKSDEEILLNFSK